MMAEAEGFYNTASSSSGFDDEEASYPNGWINWYCRLQGHHFFAEVDKEFVKDNFNLYGLKARIDNFDAALSMILGSAPNSAQLGNRDFMEVYRDASDLYGLIHSRFITTPKGLYYMKRKFQDREFGTCPRVLCERFSVLPLGLSEELHTHRVRLYCPKCQESYDVRSGEEHADIDGAFFGMSFPHILLQTYPFLVPLEPPIPFVAKLFGFRVHKKLSIVSVKRARGEYGTTVAQRDKEALPHVYAMCMEDEEGGGGAVKEEDTSPSSASASSSLRSTSIRAVAGGSASASSASSSAAASSPVAAASPVSGQPGSGSSVSASSASGSSVSASSVSGSSLSGSSVSGTSTSASSSSMSASSAMAEGIIGEAEDVIAGANGAENDTIEAGVGSRTRGRSASGKGGITKESYRGNNRK